MFSKITKSNHPKYFTDSRKIRILISLHDLFFFFRKKPLYPPEKVTSILVCNWASFGDVFLSTAILAPLKKKWPDVRIDFLTSPASKIVIENHPLINKIYTTINWKPQNSDFSLLCRLGIFLKHLITSNAPLLKEINVNQYDLAIDLNPFFPNCCYSLLRKTNIPYLLEFSSAGCYSPFSCAIDFPEKLGYLPKMYSFLLQKLNIPPSPLKPSLSFLETSPLKNYIVLHMGTKEIQKEWPISQWKILAHKLSCKKFTLVFTGKGEREQKAIQEISSSLPNTINLCDELNWNEFVSVLKEARAIISVDTVTIHLAAAFDIPILGLYFATKHIELWMPDYGKTHFLVQATPHIYLSNPSFLKDRSDVTVLGSITPHDVYSCFKNLCSLSSAIS